MDRLIDLGESHEWALLTGAGFSANWGAPVAQGVWSDIFSYHAVQAHDDLRQALLNQDNRFDFETVLFFAQRGDFGDEGRMAMEAAVADAYETIDGIARNSWLTRNRADCFHLAAQFVLRDKTSFIFTLNQDMVLERILNFGHGNWVGRPGVAKPPRKPSPEGWVQPRAGTSDPDEAVQVPSLGDEPDSWPHIAGGAHYIKLHGSYDWRLSDGSQGMVLGGGKSQMIDRYPLLKFYFQVFTDYINSGDKRLLIIGYGFKDGHVNTLLANAIEKHGLRIHVCELRSPKTMLQEFFDVDGHGRTIWRGLCGYSCEPLPIGARPDDPTRSLYPCPEMYRFLYRVLGGEFTPWNQHTHYNSEFGD